MAEENILEKKESRADLRYVPLCKPIINVMCLPNDEKSGEAFTKVLDNYIDESN